MPKKIIDKLYYEKLGENFDLFISDYDTEQRIKMINNLLPPNHNDMACVEIGCGTGRISKELKSKVKFLTVVDISQKLAERVGKKLSIEYKSMDACNLEFLSETFDLVVSSECIEHTEDPLRAIREMARITKKGGSLIFTTPNKLWFPVMQMAASLKIRKFRGHEQWITPLKAVQTLKADNFINIKLRGCHLLPWHIPGIKFILPFFDKAGNILYPLMINFGVSGQKF